MIISGILEIISKTTFYQTKIPLPVKGKPDPAPMASPPIQSPPLKPTKAKQAPGKSKANFCPECGNKIPENATFCNECGKKMS